MVIRRLRRLARLYGAAPSFAVCSATVGNPAELFCTLTGVSSPLVVTEDGSPRGRRRLFFWNPPLRQQATFIPEGKGVPLAEGGQGSSRDGGGTGSSGERHGEARGERGECTVGREGDTKMRRWERASNLAGGQGGEGGEGQAWERTEASWEQVGFARSSEGREERAWRESSNIESAVLFSELVSAGFKTICFCSVRKICELVLSYSRQHLSSTSPSLSQLVTSYRGGLNAVDRRRVERELYAGDLRGVTATSSLELGVDIASLDAVVINGFPGSIASLWQRAGRCGRRASDDSLAFLVAYPSAIDQWCMRHAARLAARPPERVVIDTANPMVLSLHLLCAAGEQPLSSADASLFPRGLFESVVTDLQRKEKLFPIPLPSRGGRKGGSREGASGACGEELEQGAGLEEDAMERDDGRGCGEGMERGECGMYEWRPDVLNGSAVEACNLRSIDPKRVEVLLHTRKRRTQRAISEAWGQGEEEGEDGEQVVEVIDEVEQWRVYYELFEGAIYFNQGRKVKVILVDLARGEVHVVPSTARYYTSSNDSTRIYILQRVASEPLHREGGSMLLPEERGEGDGTCQLHLGRVQIRLAVSSFVKLWQKTHEAFEEVWQKRVGLGVLGWLAFDGVCDAW
ncbi:MAG: hypothetical protein SGPRY_004131 [Prymnesium sp.]